MKSFSTIANQRVASGIAATMIAAMPLWNASSVQAKTLPVAPSPTRVPKKSAHKSKYDTAIHRIDFNGAVTHIAADGHSMIVVDGKRRMTVRCQGAGSFRIGQKVSVSGTLFEKYIVASKITRR